MAAHKHSIRQRNVDSILLAAEKVFAEKGFAGTAMADIAEQVGLLGRRGGRKRRSVVEIRR